MRLLNLIVAVLLVVAAAYVYKIKFEATIEAERVAKLRTEIARERNSAAALRAEAAKLENPGRIQALAQRHLKLQLLDPAQIDTFDALPARPAEPAPAESDPIAAMLEAAVPGSGQPGTGHPGEPTGSVTPRRQP
ncbi:MAG: hypothetical protein HXX10_00950 [Rhodoplanes sp.]|uniref:cell division protein FtsL n=1 Tax=Rhodoplanes sp. TaxID=1968906 RepID=UPI001837C982|nr:hypothetical protein [Rhodoplanes sp.]NVO12581.1 hypothetical protein [Rhodoplanes sp.]